MLKAGISYWQPSFAGDRIYFVYHSGLVSAVDVRSQAILWENEDLIALAGDRSECASDLESAPAYVSKDDRYVVAACAGATVLLDARTGQALWQQETPPPSSVLFTQDESVVYVGMRDGSISSRSVVTGELVRHFKGALAPMGVAHNDVQSEVLVGMSGAAPVVLHYDQLGITAATALDSDAMRSLSQSRSGKIIAGIIGNKIVVYSLPRYEKLVEIDNPDHAINIRFSDDDQLVYASYLTEESTIDFMASGATFGYIQSYRVSDGSKVESTLRRRTNPGTGMPSQISTSTRKAASSSASLATA